MSQTAESTPAKIALNNTFRKERFIFLHIPKCAGTSINMNVLGFQVGHLGYRHYESQMGTALQDYFIFSIARHPESRFRSAYRFLKAGGMNATDRRIGEGLGSLNDTLQDVASNKMRHVHFRPQVEFLISSSHNILVNYVHRIEDDPAYFFRVLRHNVSGFVADAIENAMTEKNVRNASTKTPKAAGGDDLDLDLLRKVYGADYWKLGYS